MQIVTCTLRFCASCSAAAAIILMAARFRYFREGRSTADASMIAVRSRAASLSMGDMISAAAALKSLLRVFLSASASDLVLVALSRTPLSKIGRQNLHLGHHRAGRQFGYRQHRLGDIFGQ